MTAISKVRDEHLSRLACVYVRQSTLFGVQEHQESTRRQYALSRRCRALGWPAERIQVIDEDLGHSASDPAHPRAGFQKLLARVVTGEVGAIFAVEVLPGPPGLGRPSPGGSGRPDRHPAAGRAAGLRPALARRPLDAGPQGAAVLQRDPPDAPAAVREPAAQGPAPRIAPQFARRPDQRAAPGHRAWIPTSRCKGRCTCSSSASASAGA